MTYPMAHAPQTEAEEKRRFDACRARLAAASGSYTLTMEPMGEPVWFVPAGASTGGGLVQPFRYVLQHGGVTTYRGNLPGAEMAASQIISDAEKAAAAERERNTPIDRMNMVIGPDGRPLPSAADMERARAKAELKAEILAELRAAGVIS